VLCCFSAIGVAAAGGASGVPLASSLKLPLPLLAALPGCWLRPHLAAALTHFLSLALTHSL
jgi:hypothetical protein